MANGPFGNPLSTGIALSGVIDLVTPVRQAEERKRQREAAEKKAQDERAKELGAIMGKIAIDEDKIWWRYHDDARLQYADTIDKVSQMYNAGDYAGMYKTINQFDTKMANYIQATNQKNARAEELKKGGYYMDYNLESMSENRDIDNAEYAKYLQETGYGTLGQDGIFSYMPNSKVFDIKDAWERSVKGEEKKLITEAGKGYKQVGTTPTGVIAQTDYAPDVLSSAQQRIMNEVYADPYRAARILEKEGYDVKSLESIADPQQRAIRTQEMFSDYIMKNRPGVGEQILGKWKPSESKTGADFIGGIGMKQTGAGETVSMQIPNYEALRKDSSPLVNGIISQVTGEDKLKKLNRNLAPSGVQFENVIDSPFDDKNYVSINYGGESKEFVIGDEASVKGAVDWLVKQGISDAQLEEFTKEMGVDVPKSSQDLINFTDQIRIQSTGKTDISKKFTLPAGDIIAKGTSGAKKVNIKNKIPVLGASIDNIGVDDSGKLWATISYPVKEDDDVLTKLFGNKNDIESFKKSAGSLPTTFIVPYDEDIKSTVLSLDKNMTEALLDQKLSALKGASGTQSSEYTQITKLKDASGNSINAGVKGGKWYNIDTGEEIK